MRAGKSLRRPGRLTKILLPQGFIGTQQAQAAPLYGKSFSQMSQGNVRWFQELSQEFH
jgi:hypothetical protein